MEDKMKKGGRDRVVGEGREVDGYEIMCVDRRRGGMYGKEGVEECVLKGDGGCRWSCMKGKVDEVGW